MNTVIVYALIGVTLFFFLLNTIYLLILLIAIISLNRKKRLHFAFDMTQAFKFRLLPPISVILPAYNEEKNITQSVKSLLSISYPEYELIVVNDGSKDRTLDVLKDEFNLKRTDFVFRKSIPTEDVKDIYISDSYKNLIVIDKVNGGKADALNTGINVSNYPYFCAIDADSVLGEDALVKLIHPFIDDPERTVAVGGVVRAANGCTFYQGRILRESLPKNILVLFQTIEYARAFFMGRLGLAAINSLLIISGAFGLFKKEDVIKVKGYKKHSLGEDMMLVMKLHKLKRKEKKRYRISFVPDTVCWTEMPSKLKILKKQRVRWQMGLLESISDNIDMFLNPKYGIVGLFAIPFYFVSEVIPPFIEFATYIVVGISLYIGILPISFIYYFLLITWAYGAILSLIAILMEHYSLSAPANFKFVIPKFFVSFLENFFYRQANLIYKIIGVFKYLAKKREWGEMERQGFKKASQKDRMLKQTGK